MTDYHNSISGSILRTVAYFDLFDYPLTAEQIFNFLPQNSVSVTDVSVAAQQLVASKELIQEHSYFLLPSNRRDIAEKREEDERRAEKRLKYARVISRFIKSIPYTRAVFVTGSLSKNVAGSSSDIDFMIVAAPGRLWICRTLLTGFRKIFLFGNSKFFCTNFYLTEHAYAQQQRNIYTAIEVVTTKVIWNGNAFSEFQEQNQWTKGFLPNVSVTADEKLLIASSRSLTQRWLETMLNILPLNRINMALMEFHRRHWQRIFKHVDSERLNSMFTISPDISSGWPDNCQESILSGFHRKLSSLGLQESQ